MSAAGDALREQAKRFEDDADGFNRHIEVLLGKRDYARQQAAKLGIAARDADREAEREGEG